MSTLDGRIRGRVIGGTNEFLGIPYAAPPVGSLRWRPPQPIAPWTGVRAVTRPPPGCAHRASEVRPESVNQNCLDLSIYRPRGTTAGDRLPVLFWIHGGALTSGSSGQHNGSLFADTDHIEVVSIDYRLGAFGFLDLPGLPGGAAVSGDYGLLDQEAALKWTYANIAGFGGNPGAITIAGESAGAYSVCALLTSPPVQGLFSRAILQSGSCRSQSAATAERHAVAFARAAGCVDRATMARCLRGKSTRQILDDPRYPPDRVPIAAGRALPAAPAVQIARGEFAHVPVLIGTNRNESRLFSKRFARSSETRYVAMIRHEYGIEADAVLSKYPWSSFPEPYRTAYALGAVWTDSSFVLGIGGCGEQHLAGEFARRTPTWFYEFDDLSAPATDRKLPGYRMGAAHTMELPYMWPSYDNGTPYAELTAAQRELSRWMLRYWGAFIRLGSPAVPGQPVWPNYGGSHKLMSLREGDASRAIPTADFEAEHRCGFWDALPGEPR
ncbi:MAG TPA: carboxylesterase family protein [Solirubrobacteraceae bacterium]|nr:carboxylesterase family protein [Solirubrobacteraceae bacterium]